MKIIYAQENDALEIMEIINGAKKHLNEQGIDQWQNGYPNIERIKDDILAQKGCILVDNKEIMAYFLAEFDGDKDYENIDGKWETERNSVVLHRVAMSVKHRGQGLSKHIFLQVAKMCLEKNVEGIRIDTHEDNKKMQHILKKNGFEYRGIVYVEGKKRMAFDKKIN